MRTALLVRRCRAAGRRTRRRRAAPRCRRRRRRSSSRAPTSTRSSVTVVVPEGVVDVLEPVEVEDHDGGARATGRPATSRERGGQFLLQSGRFGSPVSASCRASCRSRPMSSPLLQRDPGVVGHRLEQQDVVVARRCGRRPSRSATTRMPTMLGATAQRDGDRVAQAHGRRASARARRRPGCSAGDRAASRRPRRRAESSHVGRRSRAVPDVRREPPGRAEPITSTTSRRRRRGRPTVGPLAACSRSLACAAGRCRWTSSTSGALRHRPAEPVEPLEVQVPLGQGRVARGRPAGPGCRRPAGAIRRRSTPQGVRTAIRPSVTPIAGTASEPASVSRARMLTPPS